MAAYAVDALAWCRASLGKGYYAGGCRCEVTCPTQDCSGWIVAASRVAGLPMVCINSAGFAIWGREAGTLISEQEAIWTPFALGIKGPNGGEDGNGPKGHIFPMVGDGAHTYEAMSTRRGCTIGSATGRHAVRWMKVPGLIYGPKPPPAPPKPIYKEQDMVILPGVARPESRIRWAAPASSGEWIWLFDGGKVLGMDAPHPGDPAERRRWYPKNADGSNAGTSANPLIGLQKDSKYLIAGRLDGGIYRGEIDAS